MLVETVKELFNTADIQENVRTQIKVICTGKDLPTA